MIHVISLGAGVQSTTMALMAAHGDIEPMPDAAVFADTGDEPAQVYEHLKWLRSDNVLPFPVHVVRRPMSLSSVVMAAAEAKRNGDTIYGQKGGPPFFVKANGEDRQMLPRQCTKNFKIEALEGMQRRLIEAAGHTTKEGPVVTVWMGISRDEASRMRTAQRPWITNRYPLAMEHGMTRADCLRWMEANGYPRPPRSACWHCPYRSDREWRELRDDHPQDWQKAVAFDADIRGGLAGMVENKSVYLHPSCVPLDQVDLRTPEDHGQQGLWGAECEGMCGM